MKSKAESTGNEEESLQCTNKFCYMWDVIAEEVTAKTRSGVSLRSR